MGDVPATVAVISQRQYRSARCTSGSKISSILVPGVTIVDAAEVGDTQINIRGINGARDAENSIALVIDGILMTNPAAVNREYTNLQQIEIVKGPQGAFYGRNASAGAIIITTQQPGEELGAQRQRQRRRGRFVQAARQRQRSARRLAGLERQR